MYKTRVLTEKEKEQNKIIDRINDNFKEQRYNPYFITPIGIILQSPYQNEKK